ncbi:MAG: hypothetical protein RLZZ459_757, partial [Cyanobacteriota bacterium]
MATAQQSSDAPLASAGLPEITEAGPEELNQWKRGFTPQA